MRKLSKSDLEIWRKMDPVDEVTAREREAWQKACSHGHWHHRNDGKISTCSSCGRVRDNEP